MSQNPYNSPNQGPGGIGPGNMNNMNNPRMGMMGPNMNRMPMGYQDQMSGGMGYPIRAMGGGPNMGNMGPGNRMMGPGPGMMRGPGPGQYPGAQGQAPRMMNPGSGGVAQPPRMPPTTPMDTSSPGPGPPVPVSSGGQMSGTASGPVTGGDTGAVTMTDGGGQQPETQTAAPPPGAQTGATSTAGVQSTGKVTPSPQKEVNISTVCRIGQETVEVSCIKASLSLVHLQVNYRVIKRIRLQGCCRTSEVQKGFYVTKIMRKLLFGRKVTPLVIINGQEAGYFLQLANSKIYQEGFPPARINIVGKTFAKHLCL